jgi:hypothetical protein
VLTLLLCVAPAASPKPSSKRPVDEPPPEDLGDVAEDIGATTSKNRPPTKKVDPETPPLVVPTIKGPRVPKCGKSAGVQRG